MYTNNTVEYAQQLILDACRRIQTEVKQDISSSINNPNLDAEVERFLSRLILDQINLISQSGVLYHFPAETPAFVIASSSAMLLTFAHINSITILPAGFREGMGESYLGFAFLPHMFYEKLNDVLNENGCEDMQDYFNFIGVILTFFLDLERNQQDTELVERFMKNLGVNNARDVFFKMTSEIGIPINAIIELLKKSTIVTQIWFNDFVAFFENKI